MQHAKSIADALASIDQPNSDVDLTLHGLGFDYLMLRTAMSQSTLPNFSNLRACIVAFEVQRPPTKTMFTIRTISLTTPTPPLATIAPAAIPVTLVVVCFPGMEELGITPEKIAEIMASRSILFILEDLISSRIIVILIMALLHLLLIRASLLFSPTPNLVFLGLLLDNNGALYVCPLSMGPLNAHINFLGPTPFAHLLVHILLLLKIHFGIRTSVPLTT